MRLTPLDIRKQEFTRRVRGVDADEVSAFLQTVSVQWDELVSDQRQLEAKVREMETKLQHYVHVEEALQEALRTARESAKQTLESAKQQGEGIVAAARQQAEEIRRAAEQERAELRREATEVQSRRDEIVARLRAFLNSEMELLVRFESDRVNAATPPPLSSVASPATESNGAGTHPSPAPAPPAPPAPLVRPAETPSAGGDAGASPAEREDSRFASGWVVKPVIGNAARPPAPHPEEPPAEPAPQEEEKFGFAASEDELARIRQILKDLD